MTQYESILSVAKSKGVKGFTYHDCALISNSVHKRIREIEGKGYRFKKSLEKRKGTPPVLRLWLIKEPKVKS